MITLKFQIETRVHIDIRAYHEFLVSPFAMKRSLYSDIDLKPSLNLNTQVFILAICSYYSQVAPRGYLYDSWLQVAGSDSRFSANFLLKKDDLYLPR